MPGFAEGDWVRSMLGWRERRDRRTATAVAARPCASRRRRPALGVLGMPGFTAWIGLDEIGQVTDGETIFVSGAAGAVGSTAAQIAKLQGLRVIGSAGSPEKVEWLRSLGIEAFDYRETADLREALADGIDVYFDNVGGEQLEAALGALRPFGRVVACGAISRYNDERAAARPAQPTGSSSPSGCACQGFIVFDHDDRFPEFLAEVGAWVRDGKLELPRDDRRRVRATCRARSPASSAATTSARCSSASAPTTRSELKSTTVEPSSVWPVIVNTHMRGSTDRGADIGAVPGLQARDVTRRSTSFPSSVICTSVSPSGAASAGASPPAQS